MLELAQTPSVNTNTPPAKILFRSGAWQLCVVRSWVPGINQRVTLIGCHHPVSFFIGRDNINHPPIGCTGKSGPPIGLANFWNAAQCQWFLTTYVWLEIYHKMVNIWGESCCGLITNYRSFYIFFLRKADVLHLQKENFARRLPSFSGIFIWRLTLSFAIFKTYYSLFF